MGCWHRARAAQSATRTAHRRRRPGPVRIFRTIRRSRRHRIRADHNRGCRCTGRRRTHVRWRRCRTSHRIRRTRRSVPRIAVRTGVGVGALRASYVRDLRRPDQAELRCRPCVPTAGRRTRRRRALQRAALMWPGSPGRREARHQSETPKVDKRPFRPEGARRFWRARMCLSRCATRHHSASAVC